MERDIGQTEVFDAVFVAEAEIDSLGTGEVGGEAGDEKIVFGGDGTLHGAAGGRGVFADVEAFVGGALQD